MSITKKAVESYAQYEQLVGGVETLFKDSAKTVQKYAANAYKTAGMSANQYMETVTSFSASLLQSLSGDTEKAAEVADMALTDMADNANKMGTAMESIEAAYQGFSKGQYQLLDNLKLGYGGTKTEMERLLKDAQKISGVKYDIDNLNDVYQAIHVIQTELGITGTTAKEAASTISGSIASMKSAWENFTTGLADENANVEELTQNLINSVGVVAGNLMPVIGEVLKTIGTMILNGIGSAFQSGYEALDGWLNSLGASVQSWLNAKLAEFLGWASELKGSAQAAWNDFVSWLSGVKDQIVEPIRNARDKIRGFINDIKGFFSGLKLELPHIKLPHFSVSGKLSLNPPSVPKLSVSWYRKAMNNAMLLNSPTIFGMSGGNLLGAGEAGQEVVAGSDTLMGMIRNAVKTENGGGNIINIYPQNLTEAQIDYLFTRFNAKMGAMA